MRSIIAHIAEGVFVGLCMGGLLVLFDVELEIFQFALLCFGAMMFTGMGSGLRRLIEGKVQLYNYEWVFQYGEQSILVKASKTEELYINDKLADNKTGVSFGKVELKGLLDTGERITAVISGEKIKKAISSDRYLRCELLVDGKPLRV